MGERISLRSNIQGHQLEAAIELASKKLHEAESRLGKAAPYKVAVIALLDMAEDYLRAKKRTAEHFETIEKKSQSLFELVKEECQTPEES